MCGDLKFIHRSAAWASRCVYTIIELQRDITKKRHAQDRIFIPAKINIK